MWAFVPDPESARLPLGRSLSAAVGAGCWSGRFRAATGARRAEDVSVDRHRDGGAERRLIEGKRQIDFTVFWPWVVVRLRVVCGTGWVQSFGWLDPANRDANASGGSCGR